MEENRVANPVQWLLDRVPGGDPALVAMSVILVVALVIVFARGKPWAGPVAIVGIVAMMGFLNALGAASAEISAVTIGLAVLCGLAMFQFRRA